MNARRRREVPEWMQRVYESDGSWYFVPRGGKWIRLCRVSEGESRLLERLRDERAKLAAIEGIGNMPRLVGEYVKAFKDDHKEKAWPKYGDYVKPAFKNLNANQVDAAHVSKFLRTKYKDKLHMQRIMRAFLSGFFQWAIEERHAKTNPCRDVKLKKPAARTAYITDVEFAAIRDNMLKNKNGHKVPGGEMMQCFVDLCYLTAQRSTDIRELRWRQDPAAPANCSWVDQDAGVIHFKPTKTINSSGVAVDWPITAEIAAVLDRAKGIGKIKGVHVIHTLLGKPYGATGARSAWDRACERAGLDGYTVKDIRAKALTDAKRAGYNIEEIMVAAAHSDAKTTEIYIKDRETPVSGVRLSVPTSKTH